MSGQKRLVFDGDCAFCTSSARWVAARSSADVVPWQELDLATESLTEAEVSSAAYWLEPGRTPARGARAVAAALQTCGPGWSVVGGLIDLAPIRPFAALGYTIVARNRSRLPGGTPACRISPD